MQFQLPPPSLTDDQYASLQARFVVPIAVKMILDDTQQLDEGCENALHESLSQFAPDTALLCLALCARHVAMSAPDSPIVKMLDLSATRIADEYGFALLAEDEQQTRLNDRDALTLMTQVPEDLEELATLMDAVLNQCGPHSPAGLICDILSVQALVHAERAGHELAVLSVSGQKKYVVPLAQPRKFKRLSENVILFPAPIDRHERV